MGNKEIAIMGAEILSVLESHKDIPATVKIYVLSDMTKIMTNKRMAELAEETEQSKLATPAEKENPNGRED